MLGSRDCWPYSQTVFIAVSTTAAHVRYFQNRISLSPR